MNINIRIKELRELKKLSQKEFSAIIKVDSSQFSKIELGKLSLTVNQLMEISSLFNVTLDWLCFGKESKSLNTDINERLKDKDKIIAMLEQVNAFQSEKIERLEVRESNQDKSKSSHTVANVVGSKS